MEERDFINYPNHVAVTCGPGSAPAQCQCLQGKTWGLRC